MSEPASTSFVVLYVDAAGTLVEDLTPGNIFWIAEVDTQIIALQIVNLLNENGRLGDGEYRMYRRDLYDMILARIE
jgi:hypothetical protein